MAYFTTPSWYRHYVPKPPPKGRLEYLDNFRFFLTSLVIYHHVAIPYGGIGSWIYTSTKHRPGTSLSLMAFNIINQTFFMGSFFFLSGFFSAKTLKKKGTSAFIKAKWTKLGVPAVVHTIIAGPIQNVLLTAYTGGRLRWKIFPDYWRSIRGIKGPVWYCVLLLIFDAIYAIFPTLPNLSFLGILPSLVLNIAASFVIRLWYPVGTTFEPLNLQLAYLPQYICCYALGASLQEPLPPLTTAVRKILIVGSLASTASIAVLVLCFPSDYPRPLASLSGGPNLLALSYAVWNETTGYLLATMLMALFKSDKWLKKSWGTSSANYAAFLVHPVVCVAMQLWWDEWRSPGIVKTIAVGSLSVFGSLKCGEILLSRRSLKKYL